MDPRSSTASASPAPRNASTWDSLPRWTLGSYATASDISSRRVSEATNFPMPEYSSGIGNIARRKASIWDGSSTLARASTWDAFQVASDISSRRVSEAPNFLAPEYSSGARNIALRKASVQNSRVSKTATGTRASGTHNADERMTSRNNGTFAASSKRAPVTHVAGRKATDFHSPICDKFADVCPTYEVLKCGWMSSKTIDITSSDINQTFYAGNIDHIFKHNNCKCDLAMADIEAILYIYGVENTSAQNIMKDSSPKKRGLFNLNSHNKQILLASTIKFSPMKGPLSILRHASKCYQQKLLSPLYFAGYIVNFLSGRYIDFAPRFMILGIFSILGVLEGCTGRNLTTKDVETFVSLWKKPNWNEARNLIGMIDKYDDRTISSRNLYTLLYHNMYGKQLVVKMLDIQEQQNPSMFFRLIDKDDDGILSREDFCTFAAIFGRVPSAEAIDRATRKLDMDGDGKICLEDFHKAMEPILDGITWEFWLVAILITLDL